MAQYQIDIPTKVMFGAGKVAELGKEATVLGKKAFVLMDPFYKGLATAEKLLGILKEEGLSYFDCYDVVPNPRHTVVDELLVTLISEDCDIVIAIGGGSCIDTAKALALVATNGRKAWDYTAKNDEEVPVPEKDPMPLIAVSTTSGTGSEVTSYAVLNNLDKQCKGVIIGPKVYPKISIVDPELTISLPPQVTALTAIDAFSHSFESYMNPISTLWSRTIAHEGIRLFAKSIRKAVIDGTDIEARTDLAMSSMLGGMAISHIPSTLPHAMGQPLSGLTDAPHGGSIACCICQIIEWTLPHAEQQFAEITEIFNPATWELPQAEKAQMLPGILKNLWDEILSEPVSLSRYGLKEDQIEEMASMMIKYHALDVSGHPKKATMKDLIEIIKKCM